MKLQQRAGRVQAFSFLFYHQKKRRKKRGRLIPAVIVSSWGGRSCLLVSLEPCVTSLWTHCCQIPQSAVWIHLNWCVWSCCINWTSCRFSTSTSLNYFLTVFIGSHLPLSNTTTFIRGLICLPNLWLQPWLHCQQTAIIKVWNIVWFETFLFIYLFTFFFTVLQHSINLKSTVLSLSPAKCNIAINKSSRREFYE